MTEERGSDGLTQKERVFVEEYKAVGLDPSKRKDALLKAGYSEHTAQTRGLEIERRVKPHILRALRHANVTPERLAQKVDELLDAKKTIVIDKTPVDVPDNLTQARVTEMGFRLYDGFPDTKVKTTEQTARRIEVDLETLKLAQEVAGEKILDVEPLTIEEDTPPV